MKRLWETQFLGAGFRGLQERFSHRDSSGGSAAETTIQIWQAIIRGAPGLDAGGESDSQPIGLSLLFGPSPDLLNRV